jgi:hypothetical protein
MTDLRNHLHSAKREHLAERYPGDLAAEILTPRRSFRQILWIAPLAAAAVVMVVLWLRPGTTSTNGPSGQPELAISTTDESLFAVADVPHMQTDLGIAPTESAANDAVPSFSDVSAPEMPSMPSFDFSDSTAS